MVDGPMPSIDPLSGSLLPELEDRFWTLLRDALERILGADGELANQYRLHLESASSYEKLLALHDDPLDVAAMLAGISLTEEHLARYDEMTRRSANTRAMEAYNYSMADDDFMPIEDATRFLRVPEDVLHSFIKGNKGAYEITEKKIAGVRRFKLAHLKRIQDQDPSFGGRKEVRNKLIVPISAVEEDVNIAKRASLFGSAALLVS